MLKLRQGKTEFHASAHLSSLLPLPGSPPQPKKEEIEWKHYPRKQIFFLKKLIIFSILKNLGTSSSSGLSSNT